MVADVGDDTRQGNDRIQRAEDERLSWATPRCQRPKRRVRSWKARMARKKSILRNAGHRTSVK